MARRMRIGGDAQALVELDEGRFADELWERLPYETKTKVEEGELRLSVMVPPGVVAADRDAAEEGDVAYLPEENVLCVFLGAVEQARAEMVVKVGAVVEGLDGLRGLKPLQSVRLEASQ